VVDSFAWIELFIGSERGRQVRDVIGKSREIYTPDIVLAEIARKYLREGVESSIIADRLQVIAKVSIVVPIDAEVAVVAAKSYLELRDMARKNGLRDPSLFDGIVLAVARKLGAKVVTGDEHFKTLQEVIWIG